MIQQDSKQGYDIIGDIHGCHDALLRLLERLGYCEVDGVYRHPSRTAIFLGDLIDRGPGIRETLHLVKKMEQSGSAVVIVGNHEVNAIRCQKEIQQYFRSLDPEDLPGRLHRLMEATLDQFQQYPQEFQEFTDWFSGLCLFLEVDGFRAVHACWDDALIKEYQQRYHTSYLTQEFLSAARERGSLESRVIDRLTRGTSMKLPEGVNVTSKDGFIRRFFRTKFWAESPKTYGDVVFQPDPLPYDLAEHPIGESDQSRLVHYSPSAPPVFFGHYWLKGRPKPLLENVACLDYSAVNFGRLTAYQFSGERQLCEENFKWVYVDPMRPPEGAPS